MQDGVSDEDVKFTEVEQSLSGMGRLEKLVLGIQIDYDDDDFEVTNCKVSVALLCVHYSHCYAITACPRQLVCDNWCTCVYLVYNSMCVLFRHTSLSSHLTSTFIALSSFVSGQMHWQ